MDFKTFCFIVDEFKTHASHSDDMEVVINLDGVLFEIEFLGDGWSGFPDFPIRVFGKTKSARLDRRIRRGIFRQLKMTFHLPCLILLTLCRKAYQFRTNPIVYQSTEEILAQLQGVKEHIV